MRKLIARGGVLGVVGMLGVLVALAGPAFAQPGPGGAPAAAPAGAGAAAPANSTPAAAAPATAATTLPATAATPSPGTTTSTTAANARKACTDAMKADRTFAADILEALRKTDPQYGADISATLHDDDTIQVHKDAVAHVQKNERHVIYAYAAMWVVAALFVIFLWRRQQALQAEIANLRRDLEAAAGDATTGKARS